MASYIANTQKETSRLCTVQTEAEGSSLTRAGVHFSVTLLAFFLSIRAQSGMSDLADQLAWTRVPWLLLLLPVDAVTRDMMDCANLSGAMKSAETVR